MNIRFYRSETLPAGTQSKTGYIPLTILEAFPAEDVLTIDAPQEHYEKISIGGTEEINHIKIPSLLTGYSFDIATLYLYNDKLDDMKIFDWLMNFKVYKYQYFTWWVNNEYGYIAQDTFKYVVPEGYAIRITAPVEVTHTDTTINDVDKGLKSYKRCNIKVESAFPLPLYYPQEIV